MKKLILFFLISISTCAQSKEVFDTIKIDLVHSKNEIVVYTDKETCVQYFIVNNFEGIAMLPRVDTSGRPMIDYNCTSSKQKNIDDKS